MRKSSIGGLLLWLALLAITAHAATFSFVLEDAAGAPQTGLRVQVKDAGSVTVAGTDDSSLVDNGDGSYSTAADLASGEYSVFVGAGAGTLVPSLGGVSHVDPDAIPSALPIPVAEGGTGATTAAGARSALGLDIGSDVQPYSAYTAYWATLYGTYWGPVSISNPSEYVFPAMLNGAITTRYGGSMRSALGLGSAAVEDASEAAVASTLVKIPSDPALPLPVRTSHLAATVANAGKLYQLLTGNDSVGTWGVYTIKKTGTGSGYAYAVQALYESSWDFGGGS